MKHGWLLIPVILFSFSGSTQFVKAVPPVTTQGGPPLPRPSPPPPPTLTPAPPPPPPSGRRTALPVEVLRAGAATKSVEIEVDAAMRASAKRLWLKVHHLNYENKGAVSVNGGAPIWFNYATTTI